MMEGILYWITGLAGSGKTTIGNRLYYEIKKKRSNVVILDGDLLKNVVGDKGGYSYEERKERAYKYARLCKMLTDQNITVICCTIAMFEEVREWNRKNSKAYVEVFLDVELNVLKKRDQKGLYSGIENGEIRNVSGLDVEAEFPKNPDLVINNNGEISVKKCVDMILGIDVQESIYFKRDTDYWNNYYTSNNDIVIPSKFAEFISKMIVPGKTILDLGCGNGRDSIFFDVLGMNVTGIDASDKVINHLQNKYEDDGKICFICDDFVCSSMIYGGQYDYCYSRFSLHAINDEQENEVIRNVFKVLKCGGKFFIEVRSINDDIFGKGEMVARNSFIYEGHFRRFIVKRELEEKLKSVGFVIEYSAEKRDFAPYKGDNPLIIRIIASKEKGYD